MAITTLAFALFSAGYILGVWKACPVLRPTQRQREEGVPAAGSSTQLILLGIRSQVADTRR